jgi:hypothetical protein
LSIKDKDIPDAMAIAVSFGSGDESEVPESESQAEGDESDDPNLCIFTDSTGKKITGKLTGKKKKDRHIVEADGHLWFVAEAQMVTCPKIKKGAAKKSTKPNWKVGDEVHFDDDGTDECGKITKVNKNGTYEIETDDRLFSGIGQDSITPF